MATRAREVEPRSEPGGEDRSEEERSRGLRPPRQDRSRRNLDRLLESAEALLEESLFEEVTVADVVRGAGTSVGAFYTRFANKEALLPALYRRYDGRLAREVRELLGSSDWEGSNLKTRVEKLVAITVSQYRARRGLLRAVSMFSRTKPGEISAEIREARGRLHREIGAVVLARREEIDHPDPELAVEMGLFFVFAACRDKILFAVAPHAESLAVEDEVLGRELARAFLHYLKELD